MGCYLTLRDASTLEIVVVEISHRPRGAEILVAVNLNTDLESMGNNERGEAIEAAMSMEGLEDMKEQLLPHNLLWTRDGRMWSMLRCG